MERREMLLEKNAAALTPATIESAALAQAGHDEPNVAKRRGRRPSHAERWTKVTVVLMDRQIVFLDRLIADIRAANGTSIRRANLIRALIDSLAASDLDLTNSRSERDLIRVLTERLHRRPTA
jgi:hypothetical protein